MEEAQGLLCGHDACEVCGECHVQGCFCQRVLCNVALEDAIFDMADRLGFTVSFFDSNAQVFLERNELCRMFEYSAQGLVAMEVWLQDVAFQEQMAYVKRLSPSSFLSFVKRVFRMR